MEALNPIRLIHFYDTQQRRIACGVGADNRSTKHARTVTCERCIGILRAKSGEVSHAAEAGASL